MEDTDRGRYVTGYVSMWICNDGQHYEKARGVLRVGGAVMLGKFLTRTLRAAPPPTMAWHTAQELAPNDYDRVNWDSIAEYLTTE